MYTNTSYPLNFTKALSIACGQSKTIAAHYEVKTPKVGIADNEMFIRVKNGLFSPAKSDYPFVNKIEKVQKHFVLFSSRRWRIVEETDDGSH